MAIRFELPDGTTGTLDVSKLVGEEVGGQISGVKDGLVMYKDANGKRGAFSLAQWAEEHQAQIILMEGFNGPDTALDQPPNGMNYMDQSVFFQDGMDMEALSAIFPKNMERNDGRVVVMDNDGLWKTMWSPFIHAPIPPMTIEDMEQVGLLQEPELIIRTAGITFMLALAGIEATSDEEHNFKVEEILAAMEIINRNAPFEVKDQIAKLIEQTTGVKHHKFINALLAPKEVGTSLLEAKKLKLTSFNYRMMQMDMAQKIMEAQQQDVRDKMMQNLTPLAKLSEVNGLLINLKQLTGEFIQTLVGLDLLRDISKVTGLNDWIALNESSAYDPSRLPDMPSFVPHFVQLLKWIMPITKKNELSMAKGRSGFKALVNLLIMIDDCIFSLADVPDHSAKYKMMMALKRLQAGIETKINFVFHPDVNKNRDGLKENPFMMAKEQYGPIREALYKTIQNPKETWNKVLLDQLADHENVEVFYDALPDNMVKLWKAFAAMDAAYDMQPWVDVRYKERTHDAFSDYHPAFGERPPEGGYLAKNSNRSVQNISETMIIGAAVLQQMSEQEARKLLRNPYHFSLLLKSLMVASVNREIGTVEVLSKFGIGPMQDPMASPDPNRIWEDPETVQVEMDAQIEELMGELAMQQMSQSGGMGGGPAPEQPPLIEEEGPPQAGPGPMGPPQQAMPMRR